MTEKEFEESIKKGVVLVDFYTDGCGPCKAIAPILDQLTGVKVVKVNVALHPEFCTPYSVYAVPTLRFFKDGEAKGVLVGLNSKETIQSKIDELNA